MIDSAASATRPAKEPRAFSGDTCPECQMRLPLGFVDTARRTGDVVNCGDCGKPIVWARSAPTRPSLA